VFVKENDLFQVLLFDFSGSQAMRQIYLYYHLRLVVYCIKAALCAFKLGLLVFTFDSLLAKTEGPSEKGKSCNSHYCLKIFRL
jgi:hypothetical protein